LFIFLFRNFLAVSGNAGASGDSNQSAPVLKRSGSGNAPVPAQIADDLPDKEKQKNVS
jgi:hypothetical protein